MPEARDVVFLSHAMPEDTEFTVWLGIQLANNGYRVWSEATQLIGGERFWSDIEDAFDTVIGKTVVVISKCTRNKDGVLNEIERAEATAKGLGIPMSKFVVPVSVEKFERRHMPIQISRQNAIHFEDSWADGLAKLLKLLEREQFPKAARQDAVGQWVRDWYEGKHRVVDREDVLMTNTLPIVRFPARVRFFDLNVTQERLVETVDALPFPCFRHQRLIGAFAALDEVQAALPPDIPATARADLALEDFLNERIRRDEPLVARRDARNHLSSMLRQAWDGFCRKRGLSMLELASKRACWFFPKGAIEDGYVRFTDLRHEKPRRKALYGVKTRKTQDGGRSVVMHWHFAPQARMSIGEHSQVVLEPHVAFTTDGSTILGDADRSHQIRRSFCKGWFNEQWRTLHLAYLAALADGASELTVAVSADQSFALSVSPTTLTSPVTFDVPARKKARRGEPPAPEAEVVPDEDPSGSGDDAQDGFDDDSWGDPEDEDDQ